MSKPTCQCLLQGFAYPADANRITHGHHALNLVVLLETISCSSFCKPYQITACVLIYEQFAVLCLALHTLQRMSKTSLLPCLLQGGARLAEGLCRALGISQAVLVGHSAGALTAMEVFKRCRAVLSEQMRESCGASVQSPAQRGLGMILY